MNVTHRAPHEAVGTPILDIDVIYYTSIIRIPQAEQRADEGASSRSVPLELLNVAHTPKRIVSPYLPVERFDAYDAITGDYVIVFRVPYQLQDVSTLETAEMPMIIGIY